MGKRFQLSVFWGLSSFLIFVSPVLVRAGNEEDKAKALVNFTQYVDWPSRVFAQAFSDFVFGVVGDEEVSRKLAQAQKGKWLNGHPVVVQSLKSFDPAQAKAFKQCQILFISVSQKEHLGEILKALRGKPVLTVSDSEGFAGEGGMIQLDQMDHRIILRINPSPVEKGKLRISAKLMQIATIEGAAE